jgi:hypothetical protein
LSPADLPGLETLLCQGGDARLACDPLSGLNAYGCPPRPRPGQLAFGSATASTISAPAFAAAQALRSRLASGALDAEAACAGLRQELAQLCGAPAGSGVVLGASGTDVHLIAAHWAASAGGAGPLLVLMPEAAETGSGVPAALRGLHPGGWSALGGVVPAGGALAGLGPVEAVELACRDDEGQPLPLAGLDAEVEARAGQAAAQGRRVLLVLVDASKTGLLAPSPGCALRLRRRHPDHVEVLVDACQLRLSPATLGAYLGHGFLVAVTGSKFATGPAFSGALLLPPAQARRLRQSPLPPALADYSARADWPEGWAAREALRSPANAGLLLRWEAALAEARAFQALPPAAVGAFLGSFAEAVQGRLAADPALRPLALPRLDRGSAAPAGAWDGVPTLFPFLLMGQDRRPLGWEATTGVYRILLAGGVQLGQPVHCGKGPLAALRLGASMRLAAEALSPAGRGIAAVIADAMAALDRAARLAAELGRR